MKGHCFRSLLPYLTPSGAGTTLFYIAPFLVMLLYAFSGGGGLAGLGGNHAFALGARNTAVYLLCGIGAALLLGMWIALALRPRHFFVKLALPVPLMIPSAAVAVLWRALIPYESLWVLILLLVWKVTGVNAAGLAFLDQWSMVELPLVLLSDESKHPLSILLTRTGFAAPYAGAALYLLPVAVVVLATLIVRRRVAVLQ